MIKVDIISGFLGAGKTTLIKKLIAEAYKGEKLVLIENEFGEINVDGGFLKETGIEISEMSAGCICCTLVGDFNKALKEVADKYSPDRIIIEPSGVGKLSDVIVAVDNTIKEAGNMVLNSYVAVADASKVRLFVKNFGEFYNNQLEAAGTIILSRTQKMTQEKLEEAVALVRTKNEAAPIITTPWDDLNGLDILRAIEKVSLEEELLKKMHEEHEAEEAEHEHEHHHHDDDDHECCCGHHHDHEHECHHDHHDDDDHECCCGHHHEHHHHDDDDEHECCCGHHHEHEHHHHDDDDEHECCCGHHHDHDHECHHDHEGHEHHHHHHHADDVFESWGKETAKKFTKAGIEAALSKLDGGEYGQILRAKGIVNGEDGWIEFDFVPGEYEIREGKPDYTGRFCVIGAELDKHELAELFGLE